MPSLVLVSGPAGAGAGACSTGAAWVLVRTRDRLGGGCTATAVQFAVYALAAGGWVTRLPGGRLALGPTADYAEITDADELGFAAARARHYASLSASRL